MGQKKDPQIIKIEDAYRERERKYVPAGDKSIEDVMAHVLSCRDVFVTMDHPDFLPLHLPEHLTRKIQVPREITQMRERIYYVDPALDILKHDIEIRQEAKLKYPVKQNIKIGHGASKSDPTLDRIEYPAKLLTYGANLGAVEDEKLRKRLSNIFNEPLKPAIRMVSQRTRIVYFPEGDANIEIEMAFDTLLWGQTVTGHEWDEPKIEIELVKGAASDADAKRILDREEQRLTTLFALSPVYYSNPTPGLRHMAEEMKQSAAAREAVRNKIKSLKSSQFWWNGAP